MRERKSKERTTKGGRKVKAQHVNMLIEYRCDPENLNVNEVLDTLREYGAAEIIETRILPGAV